MFCSRFWSLAFVVTASLGLVQGSLAAPAEAAACSADPRYDVLRDWLGEWQVVDEAGEAVGVSSVRSILGGCAFEEVTRRADGSEEMGLFFLDLASGTWRQRWVSSSGHTGLFDLEFEDGVIVVEGSVYDDDGDEALVRGSIASRPEGGFEQHVEMSIDDGAVYSSAGVTLYLPPGQARAAAQAPAASTKPIPVAPAAPAASTPVASAPSTKVKVRSKRKAEAPVLETAMESPMTLEFELGPLADLPPGSAWRTAELAPYVTDQVNIPRVTAQSRERRGETELELVVNLRTRVRQSKVDLDVTLLSEETSIASVRQEGITLGKLIASHDPEDGKPETVRLAVDSATFAAIFADGKRPSVRLTVTVR